MVGKAQHQDLEEAGYIISTVSQNQRFECSPSAYFLLFSESGTLTHGWSCLHLRWIFKDTSRGLSPRISQTLSDIIKMTTNIKHHSVQGVSQYSEAQAAS